MSQGQLTSQEKIALDIIFRLHGESPLNREIDDWGTFYKYVYVASRVPKLAALHADVNEALQKIAREEAAPFEICSFKLGDKYYRYDRYPSNLSLETVRRAWKNSGMRDLQLAYKRGLLFERLGH